MQQITLLRTDVVTFINLKISFLEESDAFILVDFDITELRYSVFKGVVLELNSLVEIFDWSDTVNQNQWLFFSLKIKYVIRYIIVKKWMCK